MEREHPTELVDRRVEDGLQRGRAVEVVFDGRRIPAFEGETVAAALLAAGTRVLRTTARYAAPRGLYCGMGVCFECVMTVDGRPNVRTCQTQVADGMRIETQKGEGQWTLDIGSKSSPKDAPPAKEPSPTHTSSPPLPPTTKCGCGT
ncbi:MAG: (2Fe-2S)-binding protein [Candidatus Rokubacteria bacterium]|nr:(2Fe-2S)-binding protein [Candidatus Rokubacteria bacterium]MBI4589093.1 (2Fe-2S)-binding protein [Candidatus Rokubacteria bacterium]